MTERFSGAILHAVTEIQRRKVTGKEKKSFGKTLSETCHTSSRFYRDIVIKIWITEKQWQIWKMKVRIAMLLLNTRSLQIKNKTAQ